MRDRQGGDNEKGNINDHAKALAEKRWLSYVQMTAYSSRTVCYG